MAERTYGTHIYEDQEDISGLVVHNMSAMSHGPFVPTFVVFDAYSNSTSFQPPCCPLLHGLTWAAPQIAYSTIPRNGNPAGNHLGCHSSPEKWERLALEDCGSG